MNSFQLNTVAGARETADAARLLEGRVSQSELDVAARTNCLLLAGDNRRYQAAALLIPLQNRVFYSGVALDPLRVAVERLAAQFLIDELTMVCPQEQVAWLSEKGYQLTHSPRQLRRSIRRRRTAYGRRITRLLQRLELPPDYAQLHQIPLQSEATGLVSIGDDFYGRPQRLIRGAAIAWKNMHAAASADGITLHLISAFRSVDYQAGLIERKQNNGLETDEILAYSAAPGFSEHHTGRAIDLNTPGCAVLEEEFELTDAYRWLKSHAEEHGFRETFPRNNPHRVAFEPWHWAWYE